MNTAERLDAALRAQGIPIVGVSIADEANKATWLVSFAGIATPQHRIDGAALVAGFDPTSTSVVDAETTSTALRQAMLKDRLADLALLASVTDATWAAATVPQKIAKVRALAATWQALRLFAEKNL